MKKLSRNEMKNLKGGNKPLPAGCKCINSFDAVPIGCEGTGEGYPTYCNQANPILICCSN